MSYGAMLTELDTLRTRSEAAEALHRDLSRDVLRSIDPSWKPHYAREWGAHLGNILAEYVGDLRNDNAALTAALAEARQANTILDNALSTLRDHLPIAVGDADFAAHSERQAEDALVRARAVYTPPATEA